MCKYQPIMFQWFNSQKIRSKTAWTKQRTQLTSDSRNDPAAHLSSDIFLFYTLSFNLSLNIKSSNYLYKNILTNKINKLSEFDP